MTFTAVIILIIAAFSHAGWNLIGKKTSPTIGFFLVAASIGTLCLLPFAITYYRVLRFFSCRIWLLIVLTGFCQATYYVGLAGAFRRGDMSIAYPMIRAVPILFVTFISLSAGRGDQLTGQSAVGMALIFLGAFLLPMSRFTEFRWSKYLNRIILFVLLAALGTTGYSVIDDTALRLVRERAHPFLRSWQVTIVYAFFEGMASSFWLGAFSLVSKTPWKALKQSLHGNSKQAALMGFGIYFTYSLVLISMAFVKDVSYVVAFRQLSIPLGVVLSVLLLKEKAYILKFAGVLIMFIGLVLVALG